MQSAGTYLGAAAPGDRTRAPGGGGSPASVLGVDEAKFHEEVGMSLLGHSSLKAALDRLE